MTKAAVKDRDEAVLPLGDMKDITPKKPDAKPPADPKPAKIKTKTSTELATMAPKTPANLDTPQDFLALITRALSLSKGDVNNVRELLAMKDEQLTKIRAQEYNVAFHAARGEMPPIVKDGKAPNFKYPTLENVSRNIDTIARAHGFTHSFATADSIIAGHYRIICDLSHTNGYEKRYFVDLPADSVGQKGTVNKSPVQAVNSTFSIGRRYLKMMIWDLVIIGSDAEAAAKNAKADVQVGKITKKQADSLGTALDVANIDKKEFCKVYNLADVADLPADLFDHALKDIAAVREERTGKEKA